MLLNLQATESLCFQNYVQERDIAPLHQTLASCRLELTKRLEKRASPWSISWSAALALHQTLYSAGVLTDAPELRWILVPCCKDWLRGVVRRLLLVVPYQYPYIGDWCERCGVCHIADMLGDRFLVTSSFDGSCFIRQGNYEACSVMAFSPCYASTRAVHLTVNAQ